MCLNQPICVSPRCFGEDIGPFSFAILKGYFIYILAFAGGIYANMQGLKKLTPETTTVVRSVGLSQMLAT
jgi:hypothetical protein